jgi:hypothetical protein
MRINELLTESQLQHLEEGPITQAIGKVGGKIAKGVAGVGKDLKTGFKAGYSGEEPAAPAPSGTPAATTPAPKKGIMGKIGSAIGDFKAGYNQATAAPGGTTPPSAQDINAQGPAGTAPAVAQTGAAGAALAKTTAAVDKQTTAKAGQTVYAQVKANVDKLDKKGKQRILQLLQKSMAVPDPKPAAGAGAAAPSAEPTTAAAPSADLTTAAAPAADLTTAAAAPAADLTTAAAAPAADSTAAPANTMANAPVSATNTAAADNPNQQQTKKRGGRVKGAGPSMTPSAVRRRETRAAAAKQSKVGNAVMGNMANQLSQQNASKNNYGNALSEALAQRVEMHKQKMFETGLSQGTISVFRK